MRKLNLAQSIHRTCAASMAAVCLTMLGAGGFLQAGDLQSAGQEFSIIGQLPGDQMNPSGDMNDGKGYLVWQDNLTDGEGSGISAVGLSEGNTPTTGAFRVNVEGAGEQENPDVVILADGGAAFVWQTGITGRQAIAVRVADALGVFVGGEQPVSDESGGHQQGARLAALPDGGFAVVWTEYDDSGAAGQRHNDVYLQRFTSDGTRLGDKTRVNQRSAFNQRSPEILTLADGRLVVTWISETLRGYIDANSGAAALDPTIGGVSYWVDVHCRFFSTSGEALGAEFYVNETEKVTAHPTIGQFSNGNIVVAWSSNSGFESDARWDVALRVIDSLGRPVTNETVINAPQGDQIAPALAVSGDNALVAWTSRRSDNRSDEVRAVSVQGDGNISPEFGVNSTSYHSQLDPVIYSDGESIAAVWSGFDSTAKSFELYSQRYSTTPGNLPRPSAPFLTALSGSKVEISWNQVGGFDVEAYLIFLQDDTTPLETSDDSIIAGGFASGSTVAVKIAYRTSGGQISEASNTSVTTTWGEDGNFNGLPDDWEQSYWGSDENQWPGGLIDSDGDGEINRNEFLAGTDPTDPNDVLAIWLSSSEQGIWVNWPTTPGRFYKLQVSRDLEDWLDYTDYRFAPDDQDAVLMDSSESTLYFRILLRR